MALACCRSLFYVGERDRMFTPLRYTGRMRLGRGVRVWPPGSPSALLLPLSPGSRQQTARTPAPATLLKAFHRLLKRGFCSAGDVF